MSLRNEVEATDRQVSLRFTGSGLGKSTRPCEALLSPCTYPSYQLSINLRCDHDDLQRLYTNTSAGLNDLIESKVC